MAVTRAVIELLSASETAEPGQIRLHGPRRRWLERDAARLDQIVTNLLTNAIKYGEGRPVDVTITHHDEDARLQVSDRGIGIAPRRSEADLRPVPSARPRSDLGGLGLGLYIARSFVQMHGGRIAVE